MHSPLRFAVLPLALCIPAAIYACNEDEESGSDASTPPSADASSDAKKDAATDARKDAEGGIKGKPVPQEGGAIPDGGTGGDAGASDGGTKGCTYTITGGASGSGSCLALASYGNGALGFTLTNAGATNPLTFGATFASLSTLQAGTYSVSDMSLSAGEYEIPADDMTNPPTGSWALCWRPGDPCGSSPNTFNDVGSFTLDITSPGKSIGVAGDGGNELWSDVCGTLTADYPSQPGTNSPGTAQITAKFCGSAIPDASVPDAKGKDGATASGACLMTLSGAINGTVKCTIATEMYVTADSSTVLSISGVHPDGGALAGELEQLSIVLPGQLTTTTYTTATVAPLCTGSATCNVTSVVSYSADGGGSWEETWSPTGSSNGGTWQLAINQLGAQDPNAAGFSYVGLHGVYTGTLSVDAPHAAGTVDLTVSF